VSGWIFFFFYPSLLPWSGSPRRFATDMSKPSMQSRTAGVENNNTETADGTNTTDQDRESQNSPPSRKPSMGTKLKTWWAGLGLDPITVVMMMK
jgi:hypothetical protein